LSDMYGLIPLLECQKGLLRFKKNRRCMESVAKSGRRYQIRPDACVMWRILCNELNVGSEITLKDAKRRAQIIEHETMQRIPK